MASTPPRERGRLVAPRLARVDIWAKGFDPDGAVPVLLLGGDRLASDGWTVGRDGTISAGLTLGPDLANGEHRIEVRQGEGAAARATAASVVKAQLDDHLGEPSESRFVVRPPEPDDDEQDDGLPPAE